MLNGRVSGGKTLHGVVSCVLLCKVNSGSLKTRRQKQDYEQQNRTIDPVDIEGAFHVLRPENLRSAQSFIFGVQRGK